MTITRIATPKAHALPSTADERLAKIRKASLATQKKSRDSSRGLAFSFCVFIVLVIIAGTHPGLRPCLHVLTKNCGAFTSGSLCQHVDALTTEYQTEHKTDSKRGKDRLRRVFADVLLAVVLKTANTIDRIIPYLSRATEILIGHCACG